MSAAAKRWVFGGVLALAALGGLYGIADALNVWAAVAVGALALTLTVWRLAWFHLVVTAMHLLGATLVAFLVLVGVDVLLNLPHWRLPIWAGLVLAILVFGFAAYLYLRGRKWNGYWSALAACELTFLAIVAAPFVVGKLDAKSEQVQESKAVPSKLDLMIVGDGQPQPRPPALPRSPVLDEFDVSYSVGFATGDRVRWTLVEGTDPGQALEALARGDQLAPAGRVPATREGSDAVLLLLPDGTPAVTEDPADLPNLPFRRGEVGRWKRIAGAFPATPVFALLQTTDRARLERWKPVARPRAVSLQVLESRTATDAAARLAIGAPTAASDLSLAMKYRPVLLFDQDEPVPWPLSVRALFGEGRVQLCHDQGVVKTGCKEVGDPRELENGGTHLRLALRGSAELRALARRELEAQEEEAAPEPAAREAGSAPAEGAAPADAARVSTPPTATPPPGTVERSAVESAPAAAGSAIYVHPVEVEREGRELVYLDYWWYLPDNPVSLGGGALCGAGLVIAGVTCQSHQSDWEGMTVVVDRGGREPRIVAVQYAQHAAVVRYGWKLLRERWEDPDVRRLVAPIADAAVRPLAFIARGTHATYPIPCARCHQVAHADLGEEPHRGGLRWVGDDSGACGRSSCLQPLPTRASGAEPALWNGYEGTWGEHDCFLTYYCDSGTPPTAPGSQGRYLHPTRYDGFLDSRWRFQEAAFGE